MKIIMILLLPLVLFAGNSDLHKIKGLIDKGNFNKATILIDSLMNDDKISSEIILELSFQKEKMDRIRKDFTKTESDILQYVKKYYPNIVASDLKKWEEDGSLEFKIIDGSKYYFNRSASNLFRISKEAKLQKEKIDGIVKDNLDEFLR